MADFDPVEQEQVGSTEGQVVVDIETIPDKDRERIRDRLVGMFSPVIMRVLDAQGREMPYGLEVAQCKICGTIHRRLVGPLLTHAAYHERERRQRAPRRRR